ncbi:hypothetical protein ACIQPS_36520 [Streptomyces sp. NPDC091290]
MTNFAADDLLCSIRESTPRGDITVFIVDTAIEHNATSLAGVA